MIFLQELEADMEAVNCTCGVPVDIGKCTQPIPQGVACILYDDKVSSIDRTGDRVEKHLKIKAIFKLISLSI